MLQGTEIAQSKGADFRPTGTGTSAPLLLARCTSQVLCNCKLTWLIFAQNESYGNFLQLHASMPNSAKSKSHGACVIRLSFIDTVHADCRVQQLRLLSKLEKAGLLTLLEKNGVTLTFIEQTGLLSKAESLGLLSAAADRYAI